MWEAICLGIGVVLGFVISRYFDMNEVAKKVTLTSTRYWIALVVAALMFFAGVTFLIVVVVLVSIAGLLKIIFQKGSELFVITAICHSLGRYGYCPHTKEGSHEN